MAVWSPRIVVAGCVAALIVSSVGVTVTASPDPRVERIPYPGGRAPSPAEIDLGRRLFFDARLSSTNAVSCASCHRPDRGFSDGLRYSKGVAGTSLKRHTPHLFNLAWGKTFFWDGRATSLEEQALSPLRAADEMGLPGDGAAEKLKTIPDYLRDFDAVYPKSGISMKNIARAIAAFERTLVSHDSPYDRFEAGDTTALGAAAIRGRQLFFGHAMCSTCHSGPNFTDGLFHNTGVLGEDTGRAALDRVGEFQMRPYPFFQMRRAFKTPGLRNVALTAPYQHDGSEETLREVVRFYNLGGRDPRSYGKALDIRALNLSERDMEDLVAFLQALTSPVEVEVPAGAIRAPETAALRQ